MNSRKIHFLFCAACAALVFSARVCRAQETTDLDYSVKSALGPAAAAAQAAAGTDATVAPKADPTVADAFDEVSVSPQQTDQEVTPAGDRQKSPMQPSSEHRTGEEPADHGIAVDAGYLSGKTVYDFNNHRSELTFPLDNLMVGAAGHTRLGDAGSLHARVWVSAEDDSAEDMRNRDFDASGHVTSDTRSDASLRAFSMDVCGRYDFYVEPQTLRMGALLGYSYERLDYDMTGLYYEVDEVNGFQGQTRYSGSQVITYLIEYHTPYIGIALDAERPSWGVGAHIKYSFYPFARDRDNHVLRGLTFYADYDKNGTAWLGTLQGFWNMSGRWTARAGMDFKMISIDGVTWEENRDPQWDAPQSTDLRQVLFWTGLEYRF